MKHFIGIYMQEDGGFKAFKLTPLRTLTKGNDVLDAHAIFNPSTGWVIKNRYGHLNQRPRDIRKQYKLKPWQIWFAPLRTENDT